MAKLSRRTCAHKRALLIALLAAALACSAAPTPTREEVRAAWLSERAFWDTMRVRAAARTRERDSLHALSKLIDASIDRTRLARIAELDSVLAQRTP